MQRIVEDKLLTAKAVIGIYPAHAENETVFSEDVEFNFPRQQVDKGPDQPNYSLADFIAPKDDFLGMFAVTTGHGLEEIVKEFEDHNDDYNAIMVKVLADRMVEALAERMHERVRKEFWGYASDEQISNEELMNFHHFCNVLFLKHS